MPGLALRELDRDAGVVHAAANLSQVSLIHRGGEDVVIEDVRDGRGEVLEVLLPGLGVALLVEVELELGGRVRREAHRAGTLVLGDQDLPGRGHHGTPVLVDDVREHQRRAVEPGDHPQRGHVRLDPEVAVAVLPVGHLIPGERLHVHVEREQVVAALDPWPTTSSRKYSISIRLPKRRPCMSVKAVTIVSIVPSSPPFFSSSSVSMPRVPPGPPGRGQLPCSSPLTPRTDPISSLHGEQGSDPGD